MLNYCLFVFLMVFNASFNNISVIAWRSILLVEVTGGPGENHRPVASHLQTLSHNVVHLALIWSRFELTTSVVIDTDCIVSCKSNYHTITATTAPFAILLFYTICINYKFVFPMQPKDKISNARSNFTTDQMYTIILK